MLLPTLRVNLKLQLHHIPQTLNTPTQKLLTVRLRANPLHLVAGEQEREDGVFVV